MFLFCHAYEKKIRCTRLEAQVEVSANQSGTLNESKPKEQHEFSGRDKQRTLITNIAVLHKLWYTYGQGI